MINKNQSETNVSRLDEIAVILVSAIKRSIEREAEKKRDNSLDSLCVPSIHGENNNNGEF